MEYLPQSREKNLILAGFTLILVSLFLPVIVIEGEIEGETIPELTHQWTVFELADEGIYSYFDDEEPGLSEDLGGKSSAPRNLIVLATIISGAASFLILNAQTRNNSRNAYFASIVSAALGGITILRIQDLKKEGNDFWESIFGFIGLSGIGGDFYSLGAGSYALGVGSAVLVIAAVLGLKDLNDRSVKNLKLEDQFYLIYEQSEDEKNNRSKNMIESGTEELPSGQSEKGSNIIRDSEFIEETDV